MSDFKRHYENLKFYSINLGDDAQAAKFYVVAAIIINLFIFL